MKKEDVVRKTLNKLVMPPHPTDDELADYHDGIVSDDLKIHLQRCRICQRRLKFLQEVIAEAEAMDPSDIPESYYETARLILNPEWKKPQDIKEDGQKEKSKEDLKKLAVFLDSVIVLRIALSMKRTRFSTNRPLKHKSEDETFGVFVEEDHDHNMIVTLGSRAAKLEGKTIRFYANPGKWFQEKRLEKARENQVKAKAIIKCDERKKLPVEAILCAEVVPEDDKLH